MFSNANDLANGEVLTADVCIVGAGAAGITIARDLIASGLRVVLLESGGEGREQQTQNLYRGSSTGFNANALAFCRLRFYGGSTNHWAGWCQPIEAEVFRDRPGVAEGWPLSLETLTPWYGKAQETCGLGALEYEAGGVARRAEKSVLPFDPERVSQVLYQYSEPRRFGPHYREDLEHAGNIGVYLNANLVDIRLSESGRAVERVICATLNGTRFEVRAGQFVLAMGGIENARMLLASRSQNPAGVGNDHGLVGRYFMEHPHFYNAAGFALRPDIDLSFFTGRHQVETVDEQHADGVPTRLMAGAAIARPLCEREQLINMTFQFVAVSDEDAASFAELLGVERIGALLGGVNSGNTALYAINIRSEQRPYANSRVSLLDDDEDALGVPRTHLHWDIAEQDFSDIYRSLAFLGAEFGRTGSGRLWISPDREADGVYSSDNVQGGCHHMGTTRMADSPAEGVVDSDCRVHGLDNLYIAGSSVFPAAGSANPTLTIVALAHRLAAKLKETGS